MQHSTAKKNTLILGASENPARYSNMALHLLRQYGHPVEAIGHKKGLIDDVEIHTEWKVNSEVDTITLYLNPQNQKPYYTHIIAAKPKRVIFNPGTENEELQEYLQKNKIPFMEACTLVLLHTGQF